MITAIYIQVPLSIDEAKECSVVVLAHTIYVDFIFAFPNIQLDGNIKWQDAVVQQITSTRRPLVRPS